MITKNRSLSGFLLLKADDKSCRSSDKKPKTHPFGCVQQCVKRFRTLVLPLIRRIGLSTKQNTMICRWQIMGSESCHSSDKKTKNTPVWVCFLFFCGVSKEIRTLDLQGHNLTL